MFELSLLCPQQWVETLSDALAALGAQSVSVEDADAQTDAEQAVFGEPGMPASEQGWQRSRVAALYDGELSANAALQWLRAQEFFADCQFQRVHELPQQDWVRLTQSQFAPVEITPWFWIVPSWHEPPEQASVAIRLDPGLAFGTGTHPTTRMCLRWIAQHAGTERSAGDNALGRVLDYGCGSGILAIGAAKLGATDIDAVDIDDAAVESARLNAQANQARLRVGLPHSVSGLYQTVLANILATPLKVLAALLCSRLAPGGTLVLAGILERQAPELAAAYAPYCKLVVSEPGGRLDTDDGNALKLCRPHATMPRP